VPGVKFEVEKNLITVSGISKQLVGEFAARIRSTKKVEPYKGKGIKYVGEIVKKKAGKTAAKAAA
jgi:large subunit ribosomal protein L6